MNLFYLRKVCPESWISNDSEKYETQAEGKFNENSELKEFLSVSQTCVCDSIHAINHHAFIAS